MSSDITIKFANQKAAECFATWLCEAGEQDYWEWMKYHEEETEDKDITVLKFEYHAILDRSKSDDDPTKYGEFLADNTIRTNLGRLDDD